LKITRPIIHKSFDALLGLNDHCDRHRSETPAA
jgi:hypothetical protein